MNISEKMRYAGDEHVTILRVTENAYLIEDDRNATAYVITGSEKAVAVDSLLGLQDYAALVKSITDKPVVLVNTHAHGDHTGGNKYFDKCYIGEAELDSYSGDSPAEIMREGDVIDLGDRLLEVIGFAGHTPGALCLLDRKERVLYTGDSILGRTVWLWMGNSTPVSVMKESLIHINTFRNAFDHIATGHGRALDPAEIIDELINACDAILTGGPAEKFGTTELHGRQLNVCYYKGEDGMQATLVYRDDLVK